MERAKCKNKMIKKKESKNQNEAKVHGQMKIGNNDGKNERVFKSNSNRIYSDDDCTSF